MKGREAGQAAVDACRAFFPEASVEFVPRKEFYYSWKVSRDSARIQISDYMDGSPDDVLRDLCTMVCRRAKGLRWCESDLLLSYLRSDGFVSSNRPTYIRRSKNLLRTDHGEHADLFDSLQRLMDAGLISSDDITNSYISWTRRDSTRRVGFCSTMFRVIGISSALDSESVPDHVRDYVVYHECLHLRQGYHPGNRYHDASFRAWEHSYPGWKDAEGFLRKL